jgi:hypothetical protein
MEHVHAEYIKETPSFVRVDMKLTKSRACDAAKYVYGPYTLQKRTQKSKKVDESATSGKVVDPVDTQEVLIGFSMMGGQNTKKNKRDTLTHVTNTRRSVMSGNKNASAIKFNKMVDSIIKQVDTIQIKGKDDLVKKLREKKISDDEMTSMTKFGSVTDDEDGSEINEDEKGSDSHEEEEDESGDEKDQKQEDTVQLTAKALSAHVEKVTNVKGAPSEPNDATAAKGRISTKKKETSNDTTTTIVDAGKSKKTPTATKTTSAKKKGADTEGDGGKEKTTVMVHIDCWFYTVPIDDKKDPNVIETMIKEAAVDEGVLDGPGLANVRATTTTVTRSALCISSSLISPTPASETPHAGPDGTGHGAQVPGGDAHKPSFGAKNIYVDVDFSHFTSGCLIKYIQERVQCTDDATAVEAVDAIGTEKAAPVYIFYTVEPPEGSGETKVHSDHNKKKKAPIPNDEAKKLNKEYNRINTNGKNYHLRSYVPSVLAERVVLDAMMDLVTRCVDKHQGYVVATRAIQTIMLSDVEYIVADGATTQLAPMEPAKPAKPAEPAVLHDVAIDDVPLVDFGATSTEDFKHKVKAALFVNGGDGLMNEQASIVSALYDIRLADVIGLATFQGLTKDKKGKMKLAVAKHASSAMAPSDGLVMRAMVVGDYMMVVTEKPVAGPDRYSAYNFTLKEQGNEKFTSTHADAFKSIIGNVKAVKAVQDVSAGVSVANIVKSLITELTRSTTYIMGGENVDTKIRAIRILLASTLNEETKKILNDALDHQPKIVQQAPAPAQAQAHVFLEGTVTKLADTIVNNIKRLDELFLEYTLNPNYEWKNDATSDKLDDLNVPVRYYNWHGDRSFQRIVAQYAMKVDEVFSTKTDEKYTTTDLLEMYNQVNTKKRKVELHKENASLYYTCLFVTALRDQNFGALFTSQPNFSTKPVNDDKPSEPHYDKEYNLQRPDCGEHGGNSPIGVVYSDEETVDLSKINKAVSFVDGLIKAGVLSKRDTTNNLLDCKGTLEQLDGMLSEIKKDDIGNYTQGGAGKSTEYEAMLGQSMKCFVMFLPLIESMVRKQYEKEAEKEEVSEDFIRSKALSYGCVSHGLDPKHIIAVRYAMIKDKKTYDSRSYPLSRQICGELFGLLEEESTDSDLFPVTRELMRTRVLGAITVIEDVQKRENGASDFGRSYLKPKRASMFI